MIQEFLALSKGKKIAIGIILAVCLALGIGIPFIIEKLNISPLKNPPTIIETPANITPTASVPVPASLTLSSDKTSYKLGETVTVSINLDSGTYGVGAADFVINFDPKVLKPTLVTQGNFFKVIANKNIQTDFVKISTIAEVTDNGVNFPSGRGKVATVQFDTLTEAAQTGITVDKQKTVIASDGKNILDKTADLTISVNP